MRVVARIFFPATIFDCLLLTLLPHSAPSKSSIINNASPAHFALRNSFFRIGSLKNKLDSSNDEVCQRCVTRPFYLLISSEVLKLLLLFVDLRNFLSVDHGNDCLFACEGRVKVLDVQHVSRELGFKRRLNLLLQDLFFVKTVKPRVC